jgi:hypothetical protein
MDRKLFLTDRRLYWISKFWDNDSYNRLEQKYGDYIYVPLDVPKILPDNQEEFVKFYFDNAKTMDKLRPDAISDQYITPTYLTIDSAPTRLYSLPENINYVPDLNIKFKSITEQILEYLPFKNVTFKLWSSYTDQLWHRDMSCMADIPSQFRIMLYDTNPAPTLHLRRDLPDNPIAEDFTVMNYNDTNTLVWNNLRAEHSSKFIKGYTKILLIINEIDSEIDWKKYDNLLERSILKYRNNTFIDRDYKVSDYCFI